jgi:hypothetical protein
MRSHCFLTAVFLCFQTSWSITFYEPSDALAHNSIPFVNSTGSVETVGLGLNRTGYSGDLGRWTWNVAIAEEDNGQEQSSPDVLRQYWLKTSPPRDLLDPSLPWAGCLVFLTDWTTDKYVQHRDGNCNSLASNQCQDQIQENIYQILRNQFYPLTNLCSVIHEFVSNELQDLCSGWNTARTIGGKVLAIRS